MRVAVIGGRLQGVEATYLAHEAGWEVLLVDKDADVPASGLADDFLRADVASGEDWLHVLAGVDLVIPALENARALIALEEAVQAMHIPLLHDSAAYAVSSSKLVSNKLFAKLGVPAALPYPRCGFPLIAKPSGLSGSAGVRCLHSEEEFRSFSASLTDPEDWVFEGFLEGPSYSIEVLGWEGDYLPLVVTELEMDESFDCKRVLTPAELPEVLREQFAAMARTLAGAVNLKGIMDVEVILNGGELKVLEIDARLPSQTPTAVYHGTGINMLQLLGERLVRGRDWASVSLPEPQGVVYEHIRVSPTMIEVMGEHVMAEHGPLRRHDGFFGADIALTDYEPGKPEWVATLIVSGTDRRDAWNRRCQVIRSLKQELGRREFRDLYPPGTVARNFIVGSW